MKKKLIKIGKKILIGLGISISIAGPLYGLWVSLVNFLYGGMLRFVEGIIAASAHEIVTGIFQVLLFWLPGLIICILTACGGGALVEIGWDD